MAGVNSRWPNDGVLRNGHDRRETRKLFVDLFFAALAVAAISLLTMTGAFAAIWR